MTKLTQENSTKTQPTLYVLEVTPRSTPRARHGRNGVYNNPAYIVYKRTLATLMLAARMKKGSNFTGICITYYLPLPHKKGKFNAELHDTFSNNRKDVDNMDKAIMDSMQDCGIIKNDKDVSVVFSMKKWTKEKTGRIEILPFTEETYDEDVVFSYLKEKFVHLKAKLQNNEP